MRPVEGAAGGAIAFAATSEHLGVGILDFDRGPFGEHAFQFAVERDAGPREG